MKRFCLNVVFVVELIVFIISMPTIISAKQTKKEYETLYPTLTASPPKIDGVLNDGVWKNPPLEKDFITYKPLYGEVLPQKTLVWIAYDSENLYFAFKCHDSEPQKIKTSITKRDNIFNDDRVGISLDALGNKQSSYQFFVNPNGIQADILSSAVKGDDSSPDFIWESAGKLNSEGYQVEICIPLRSIRFKSRREVKMGILFTRRISRLSASGSWPEIKAGYPTFAAHTSIIYKDLKKPLNLEILPSTTFGSNNNRINPREWDKSEKFKDIGVGLKYGITSSITADVTVNPDFSQVESDAFQVEVNQRYPIFYSEKRPFFMEGMDVFDFFTLIYLPKAIHTRRIVNPHWGAKVTGTVGKTSFGMFSAGDELPDFTGDSGINSQKGGNAYFSIARGKYSLGQDNYIGGLYSGREFTGGYNRVTGVDFGYRLFKRHRFNSSFLQGISREHEGESSTAGSNINFLYLYETKRFLISTCFE
ncbi:carbohydrate binding family 9 domain-containing protein, partial [bacterium]|nr:carbohydrate binding family 9 domain-containing protein [bacterium]